MRKQRKKNEVGYALCGLGHVQYTKYITNSVDYLAVWFHSRSAHVHSHTFVSSHQDIGHAQRPDGLEGHKACSPAEQQLPGRERHDEYPVCCAQQRENDHSFDAHNLITRCVGQDGTRRRQPSLGCTAMRRGTGPRPCPRRIGHGPTGLLHCCYGLLGC